MIKYLVIKQKQIQDLTWYSKTIL